MEDQQQTAPPPSELDEFILDGLVQQRLAEALDTITIYGISELAERWGVSKQRADEIATKRLGTPWRTLKMGRAWNELQVQRFEKTWKRKTGQHIDPHPWQQAS